MAVAAYIDGNNVTQYVMEGSVTHTLNGRATGTVKMPIDYASGGYYSSLYIDPGAGERFWGRIEHIDEQGDEDQGYVVMTAVDPSSILEYRPARDADGDFSKPSFMFDYPQGPLMLQAILQNSIIHEGDLGFSLGTFQGGGVDLSGLQTDWPMSIAEIAGLLTQTGEVDVVMSYSSGGATMSAYNGNYGGDVSGAVQFRYAMGTASNCRGCRRTTDGSELMNKLWLYLGPKLDDQHWRGNITRDHPELAPLPGFSTV